MMTNRFIITQLRTMTNRLKRTIYRVIMMNNRLLIMLSRLKMMINHLRRTKNELAVMITRFGDDDKADDNYDKSIEDGENRLQFMTTQTTIMMDERSILKK